ncbi:hypothetical protein ACFLU9_02580 [Chloroflexota bacterium]
MTVVAGAGAGAGCAQPKLDKLTAITRHTENNTKTVFLISTPLLLFSQLKVPIFYITKSEFHLRNSNLKVELS